MKYTDLHCDTLYELYKKGLSYDNCRLNLRTEFEKAFSHHIQVFAIWTEHGLSPDDAWDQFLAILAHSKTAAISAKSILSVEGGALLGDDLSRLETMRKLGVRILTLVWQDHCCMGGAHNTDAGLTDFGKEAVKRCFDLGIQPDLSHASDAMFWQVAEMSKEASIPLLATHSNSHAVYGHTRNLRDRHFAAIKELGGIVGVSLCPPHLIDTSLRPATAEDVFTHVDYYLSLGGEDIVGFGADWDGTDLPEGFRHVGDLTQVAEVMAKHNYSEELIQKLFWKNFYQFAMKNL